MNCPKTKQTLQRLNIYHSKMVLPKQTETVWNIQSWLNHILKNGNQVSPDSNLHHMQLWRKIIEIKCSSLLFFNIQACNSYKQILNTSPFFFIIRVPRTENHWPPLPPPLLVTHTLRNSACDGNKLTFWLWFLHVFLTAHRQPNIHIVSSATFSWN